MNSRYLHLLCTPDKHEKLDLRETPDGTFLVGTDTGTSFRIRDGIPVFIDSGKLTDANEKSRRYYDFLSPFYQLAQAVYFYLRGGEEESRKEYLKFVDVKNGNAVLEISIGNGVNIGYLPADAEYFGIDVSWGQLRRCKKNLSRRGIDAEVYQAEAERLPFCDNTFDVVFNIGSMNYFEDKKKAIDEMFRVAKPGARMLIADETVKAANLHNRLPIYRGFFNSSRTTVGPPIDLLPQTAVDVELTEIRDGLYFCLQFRKKS